MLSLMLLLMTMSIMFLLMKHPLSMGLVLLIQTAAISACTGMMAYNFWFSYILFLVMVGGMLILFIYMTSIASNEKFKLSSKMTMLMLTLTTPTLMMTIMDPYFTQIKMINSDLLSQNHKSIFNLAMSKYLNWPENFILMAVIIYLLITLIAVVKITNIQHGPLRQEF